WATDRRADPHGRAGLARGEYLVLRPRGPWSRDPQGYGRAWGADSKPLPSGTVPDAVARWRSAAHNANDYRTDLRLKGPGTSVCTDRPLSRCSPPIIAANHAAPAPSAAPAPMANAMMIALLWV